MRDFAAHVRRHLPAAGLPTARYDAIVDELASELEARYTRHLERGANDEDAWTAATGEVPSWAQLASELAAATPGGASDVGEHRPRFNRLKRALSLDRWTHDVRISWRSLRKDRGFAAAALITLAIGLGGHAAMLAAVNATLLHPLKVPDAERIYLMANRYPRVDGSRRSGNSASPDFEDRRVHITALEDHAM